MDKSHEVIKQAINDPGPKVVAKKLKVSTALVYKWCEPPPAEEDPEQSGARNPLDRVRELYRLTNDIGLIKWLCGIADGYFVKNPQIDTSKSLGESFFCETTKMVGDFAALLEMIRTAYEDVPGIQKKEAVAIRKKWDALKSSVEHFVRNCEDELYDPNKKH